MLIDCPRMPVALRRATLALRRLAALALRAGVAAAALASTQAPAQQAGTAGHAHSQAQAQASSQASSQAHSHAPTSAANTRASLAISAAVAPDGRLWVVGLDARRRLFLRHSADDGRHWSPDAYPDIGSDQVAADGESRPKLAFGPQGVAVIAYTQPLARPYTGEIRMLRSTDGGRHFSAPFTVHQDRQVITHRFESIVFDGRGRLHVYWVDKRDNRTPRQAGASIYRAVSDDGAATFGPDTPVAASSCECCRIALQPVGDNEVAALWRHVFEGSIRDHAFLRSDASAAPDPTTGRPGMPLAAPVRATFDEWKIEACPHQGPGLATASDGGFHTVWFGERAGRAGVRYARLSATGTPLGAAVALPDERAEHADIIRHGNRVAIVWRSFDGQLTRLRAWTSDDEGGHWRLIELAQARGANDHPRLVRRDDRILAVWRTTTEVRVETIRF
jgi:hypothetical protein